MKLSEILRKIKENPDDLSELALAIQRSEELEENDIQYVEQIGKLQENNRKLVKMIPVPGDPEEKEKPEEKPPSFDDAVSEIKQARERGDY